MPDYLHCICTLPPGDADFSLRWNLLKGHFSRAVNKNESTSQSQGKRWQRRVWAPLLNDPVDFNNPMDHITGIPSNMAGYSEVSIDLIRFS
jgi:putative transposase